MRWADQQTQLESDRALYQTESDKEAEDKKNQSEAPAQMDTMLFAILLLLCVIADLIDIFTVGTLGWLVGLFVDAVLLLSIGLSKNGRKQFKRIVIGVVGDSIPILAVLPFRSIFLIWGFIKSRSATAQSISSVAHKVV
mgnify:FL=1